jgi:hypothetical protein
MTTTARDARRRDEAYGRYRNLLRHVLERLPAGWNYDRSLTVEVSRRTLNHRYASAFREVGCASLTGPSVSAPRSRTWHVVLYARGLRRLSDHAVAWVIAHELGHVAAGMPCGPILLSESEAWEQVADVTAQAWGFLLEERAFRSEIGDISLAATVR